MPVALMEVKGSQVKIELTVELSRSMLETEERIQDALNEAGCIASREALGHLIPTGVRSGSARTSGAPRVYNRSVIRRRMARSRWSGTSTSVRAAGRPTVRSF